MNFYELEKQMKKFECLSSPIPQETYIVLHVDGDNFHTFVEKRKYKRPFDEVFNNEIVFVALYLIRKLEGIYGYVQSDEMSILLRRSFDKFNRNLIKLVSKSVALASTRFTNAVHSEAGFATHVYSLPSKERVIDYFRWRMQDCFRNCFNTWCFWINVQAGKSKRAATKMFDGWNQNQKIQYLYDKNIRDIPEWQKFGTGLIWETYKKKGHDPIKKVDVVATRRRLKVDRKLPSGDEYKRYLTDKVLG